MRTVAWISPKKTGGYLVRWREEDRRIHSRFVKTRDDAEALKAEMDAVEQARRVLAGTPGIPGWDDPSHPFDAADPTYSVENYIAAVIRGNRNLRDTTRALYLRNIRVHIEGTALGRADIRTVDSAMVERYWNGLDIGNGALRNVAQLLSMAFRRALRAGIIDVNPLDRAPDIRKPPIRRRANVRPLTVEEIERLVDAAATSRDRVEMLVMAYGGLRAGEVGGLRVEDVDWGRGQLHIQQQVVRISREGLAITDLKTDAARRVITLPRSVVDELREFVDANPPAGDGRLFYGIDGGMRDAVRINASVQRAAKRSGIRTHAHALRHTAVSLWIDDGASPIDVQHMVGHTDIRMTLGTYGHRFSWGGDALAESMERRREAHRNGG